MGPIVFYDGTCGLCDWVVQFLLTHDTNAVFHFAPLQGETAKERLKPEHRKVDSLVLLAGEQEFLEAKGALRIAWLLGGWWTFLGILSFLPVWCFNWAYRLVARNRHRLFKNFTCQLPRKNKINRFLS
ncbi:MAG: DUF393 domain-containing protein [Chlamydiia bacterium]|nr:DUF393 domain-containing protein [Chlamydiia bacterium]